MKKNNKKPKILNRFVSAVLSAALLVTGVPFPSFSDGFRFERVKLVAEQPARAEDTEPPGITADLFDQSALITINTTDELKKFSWWYNRFGNSSITTNVNLAITTSSTYNGVDYIDLHEGFASIGTATNPFKGTITLTGASLATFFLLKPFFGFVDQSTRILDESGNIRNIKFLCSMGYTGDSYTMPVDYVFANTVVNPSSVTTQMECSVELMCVSAASGENVKEKDISGIIGTIGTTDKSASVKVNLKNNGLVSGTNYIVDVTGAGSIGLLCGTMNKDSVLTANIITGGANTEYNVTSTDGAAGGLVGEMKQGSALVIPTNENVGFQSVQHKITAKTYAGNLVGKGENCIIGTAVPSTMYPLNMTVGSSVQTHANAELNGDLGNGQLFGYYKVSDVTIESNTYKNCTITLSSLTNMAVKSKKGNAGGLIGMLDFSSTAAASAADSPVFKIDGGAGVADGVTTTKNLTLTFSESNCGGLIGTYKTSDLKNTLELTNVHTSLFGTAAATIGGLVGKIDDTSSAAYVKIYAARTEGNKGGGLIGTAGGTNTKGAFVDVAGYNKITGPSTGGLVSTMNYGVLRLAGTTDLTSLTSGNMILNTRDSALVYSNGTGNASDANWILKRPNASINSDDIGSWGEVIRTTNLVGIISEANFAAAHTVSIAAAAAAENDTDLVKFAKIALNIQHNTDTFSAALVMNTASANQSSTLLAGTHALGTVNLSGTGLTGLTRDGGSSPQVFTGSITSGNITLAIGEAYGVAGDTEGTGRIYGHRWSGLLSAIGGTSASISGLTVGGTCDKKATTKDSSSYFGGVAAIYQGTSETSLSGVTSSIACTIRNPLNSSISVVGGMIGGVSDEASGTLSFNGCSSTATITDNTGQNNFFGGYIARVARKSSGSIPTITINFGNTAACTVGGGSTAAPNYSNSTAKTRPLYGGLIGVVRGTNSHTIATTINIADVDADSLIINASLSGSSPNGAGGLLGYAWYDAEVSIPRLTVSGSALTATGGSGCLGGLVYDATGHWTVCGDGENDTVSFSNTTFTGSGSLGLLTTRAFNEVFLGKDDEDSYIADKKAALYLELTDKTKYDTSGATVSGVNVFDELVAYTKHPDKTDLTENHSHAIVSINTDGSGAAVIMNGTACNTYQNKANCSIKTNGNTRYYYNLDTIRTKESPTDAEKLLLWSVQQYAHTSIAGQNYFGTSFTPSGTSLDMTGLSYYTIDYDISFPFRNFSLTFYNKEIELGESGTGNSDSSARSTVNTSSQHYMMHCGLFRNAPANTVSIGTVTLSGNVGQYNSGSGFIISGKLGGDAATISKFSDTRITLSGAYIYTGNTAIVSGGYAPLVINEVGKNAELKIKDVSSGGYLSFSGYAATSLIGRAGASDGSDSNINIEFSGITLDARKTADDFSADFNTAYGSKKSIFSNATLLEQYIYSGTDSKGVYNYRWDEDWENNQHHVTYGAEIDNTVDHKDASTGKSEQRNYFGSDKFTHPTNNNATSEYGSFAANVIPYVAYIGTSNSDNIHELRVNIPVVNLTAGCGTYNDPYIITNPKQLYTAADLIRNASFSDTTFQINLPSSISGNLQWCDPASGDTPAHKAFQLNSASTPQFANGSTTFTREAVRKYLAGAYYMIDGDMAVANDFPGLGAGTSGEYAFHGVVVGKNANEGENEEPDYPTITLTEGKPFVASSNGCVIKNLKFIKGTISVAAQNEKAQFQYNGGCKAYGGVIDQIMGGDTIIDNVGITFNSTVTSGGSGTYLHTIPIGGYVGVILNGGLFFRNMDDVTNKTGITAYKTADNKKYLYRNPIIGRVLNGYAVCEDCDPLDNGDKNYFISELDSSITDKLTITSSSITAKNAQSWFVLSLLVNSGTLSDKTLYINSDSKARHLGQYDDVGCLNTIAKNATDFADKAMFVSGFAETGNVKPYLMTNYTTNGAETPSSGEWLNTSNGYAITMNGGTWILPKGYRGIGGFNAYDNNSKLTGINTDCNIRIASITPNSTELKLDMMYKSYRHEEVSSKSSYVKTKDNYTTTDNGFGLFNLLIPYNDLTITGLTVSGSIFSDYYGESDGEIFSNYGTVTAWPRPYGYTISSSARLSCGLLAGRKDNTDYKLTLNNCTIKIDTSNDGIHSGKNCGGFIGYAVKTDLIKCNAQDVKIFGRFDTGGLIGYAQECSITGRGSVEETNKSVVTLDSIIQQMRGTNNTENQGRYTGCGGIVGRTNGNITISYIKVTKATGKTGLITYDNRMYQNGKLYRSDDSTYMGGIVGCGNGGSGINVNHCEVENLSIDGNCERTGGVAGGGESTYNISNVLLDGKGTATIQANGKEPIGGIIGYIMRASTIEDVQIINYEIHKNLLENNIEPKYYTDNAYYLAPQNTMAIGIGASSADLTIKNLFISNCTVSGECRQKVGGIIGYDKEKNITGYNTVIQNITSNMVNTITASQTGYGGDLVGTGNVANLKLVGFQRSETPTDKMIAGATFTTASGSNNKYIIFSDYNGTNLPTASTAGSGSAPKLSGTATLGDDYVKSPYTLVNPRINIDTDNEFTGDGMAANAASLPIQNIITDKNAAANKPKNAYTSDGNGAVTGSRAVTIADLNLSDFNYEYPEASLTNNFAVMNVETLSHDDSHRQINGYLQLITNTNYNFGKYYTENNKDIYGVKGVYRVDIYKMQLENGKFVKMTDNVHLKIDKNDTTNKIGRFYMAGGEDVDTAEDKPTFSLIDISFYDPTSTSTVAYHLYVPVIAKKMLKYTFELATGNGTPYDYAWYTTNNRFADGTLLAENIGSSGTLYFTYSYQRTKKEWQTALDVGENFLCNYDKVLSMSRIGADGVTTPFPDSTQLVLVDANRGGKAYYSTVGDALQNNKLTLYSTSNPVSYTFYPNNPHVSGDIGFTPINLNDLLYITAKTDSSGKYAIYDQATDANDSTKAPKVEAYIGSATTPTKFREATSSDTTKYKLTIENSMENKDTPVTDETETIEISERYYLSFFTAKSYYQDNSLATAIHYYTVTSDRLSNGPAPAKSNVTPDAKQVLFANLFNQSAVTYYTVNPNIAGLNPEEINGVMNSIKVALDAKIQLTPQANITVGGQLSSVDMFQSFLVYLTKNDGNEHKRGIQGNPSAYADITISSNNGTATVNLTHTTDHKYANVGIDYVEVGANTKLGPFITGTVDGNPAIATIHAETVITYASTAQQEVQFPPHKGDDGDTGRYAGVSAYSNIGFEEGKTALSKNQAIASHKGAGYNDYHYYIISQSEPTLDIYAYASDGQRYGQLGINANDLPDNTGKVHISAAAEFDVRPISATVKNATHVKFMVTLQQKKQMDTFNYSEYDNVNDIDAYLYDVKMDIASAVKTKEYAYTYTFIVPRSDVIALDDAAAGKTNYMKMPISFDVYTGSDAPVDSNGNSINLNGNALGSFESRELTYANYKVKVTAQMIRFTSEDVIEGCGTGVSSELIYTNAKLIGDFIKK